MKKSFEKNIKEGFVELGIGIIALIMGFAILIQFIIVLKKGMDFENIWTSSFGIGPAWIYMVSGLILGILFIIEGVYKIKVKKKLY